MMDLISRDNLKEALIHCDGLGRKSFELVLLVIDKQPTIDAVPVVHGSWVYDENAYDWGIGGWCCSECGCKNDNIVCTRDMNPYLFAGSKYCPNCGADMRKGGSNE